MRLRWPVRVKLYWCRNCNIPLAFSQCSKCGGRVFRLDLGEPGDARPALPRDYELLKEALRFEFGDAADKYFASIIGRSPALMNKVPYFDEMREIYVDGSKIGKLYFDPFIRRWRFRPTKIGAQRLIEADPDAVEKIVVTKRKVLPPQLISAGRDIAKGKLVFLIREDGSIVGLSYSLGDSRVRVHTWWGEFKPIESPRTHSTLDDVLKAHREHLRILEAKAVKTIAVYHSRLGGSTIVSFSGGKDSHVALYLTLESGVEPQVLFNDTGLELPETVETVIRETEKTGLELIVAKPDTDFWQALEVFGPPARDYRWCCKICKLTPLARTVKKKWPNGALNIVAQRAYESLERARGSVAWRLRWAPYVLNVSPVLYWSQFDEWLFIISKGISVNPLYYMGYERIGCFMCPASYLAEFDLVAKTHPHLWSKWVSALERWSERLGMPREYIDYGMWRWMSQAGHRDGMARKLGIDVIVGDWMRQCKGRARLIRSAEKEEKLIRVTLSEEVNQEGLSNQLSVLKPHLIEKREGVIEASWSSARLRVEASVIEGFYEDESSLEILLDSIKSYYRWRECVGCLSCETNCPTGAIKVVIASGKPKPTINPEICIGCKLCLRNCPISEVFGEHVLAPLILRDPYAWTRASRESHEDVLEKAKTMLAPIREKPHEKSEGVLDGLADFLSSI